MAKSEPNGADTRPTDPETAQHGPVEDVREKFANLTKNAPRDQEGERAFILAKIESVERDPNLSEEERARTIEALTAMLHGCQ